jgi:biopolymer transport protein TolQ
MPLASAGPYYAFQQSDSVGKAVVLLLFTGSILTWTIMIEKGISLYRAKKASEAFIRGFRAGKSPLMFRREAEINISPVARVCEDGIEKLSEFYGISADDAARISGMGGAAGELTTARIEAVRTVLERQVSDQILGLEDKIGLLATAVSVSPFFGLFGTVWGVMMAFCGLASQGRADIAALAPGVSGALLTTVVGLVVAIPSLIGYNLLTITIRKITVYMDNFVEEFLAKIKLEQLDG